MESKLKNLKKDMPIENSKEYISNLATKAENNFIELIDKHSNRLVQLNNFINSIAYIIKDPRTENLEDQIKDQYQKSLEDLKQISIKIIENIEDSAINNIDTNTTNLLRAFSIKEKLEEGFFESIRDEEKMLVGATVVPTKKKKKLIEKILDFFKKNNSSKNKHREPSEKSPEYKVEGRNGSNKIAKEIEWDKPLASNTEAEALKELNKK